MEWIEEDLQELAKMDPEARTLLCAAVPRIYHESILGGDCRKPVSAVYNLLLPDYYGCKTADKGIQ